MKASEVDLLVLPGFKNSGEGHWQSRWERRLSTARRVELGDWHKPVYEVWRDNLVDAVRSTERPVVLIGHSLGSAIAVQTADLLRDRVRGAFLVAPPELDNPAIRPRHLLTFGPPRTDPLPFPSMVIASRDDKFCRYDRAEAMAADWGSLFVDGGQSGHFNEQSGHGPWPDGLMVFARFLSRL